MNEWTRTASHTLMVGLPGPELDAGTARRLRSLEPAGIILFARNLVSPDQTAQLIRQARDCLPGKALVAVDQEGGRVSRLEPWVGKTPTAAELVEAGEETIGAFAGATARALSSLGFNLDFAPVVDLCAADAGNGIDDRSFGTDPERVAHLAGRFLDDLQSAGIAGCLKHFPGLGRTVVDSHVELPTVPVDIEKLEGHELAPFRALAPRAASVMVGHGHYPAWDPEGPLPATGSTRIVTDTLRGQLGYEGLVVSDDLEMGAVASRDRDGAFAVSAIRAGCDLLLYCADLGRAERASGALAQEAAGDALFARRLEDAAASVGRTAERWPAPVADLCAWERARGELAGEPGD